MNTNALLQSIHHTTVAIHYHKRQLKIAAKRIHDAIIPPEPYVYMMPIVAFFIGLRYATPLSQLASMSNLYRYGLILMPLLKE